MLPRRAASAPPMARTAGLMALDDDEAPRVNPFWSEKAQLEAELDATK